MIKRYLLIILMGCAVLLSACRKGGDNLTRVPIFKVLCSQEPDKNGQIVIDGAAQDVTFTGYSSSDWRTAYLAAPGFTLRNGEGSAGNNTVTVSAEEYTIIGTRTAEIAFLFDGGLRCNYTIVQGDKNPYIRLKEPELSVSGFSGTETVTVGSNTSWTYRVDYNVGSGSGWIKQNSIGSTFVAIDFEENLTGKSRSADVLFYSEDDPSVFCYLAVTQAYKADKPVADMLDVVFSANGQGNDVSESHRSIQLLQDGTISTRFLSKYGCYAAVFNGTPARSALSAGFYKVPYTPTEPWAAKLSAGYSIELLVSRYDEPGTTQIKPFSSTEGGGTGICFRAAEGNELNFETHTGGSYRECYSGVPALKGEYYHVVGVYDAEYGSASMYVDGKLVSSINAAGTFDFMKSNVGDYYFGIGADPASSGLATNSFNGEVVLVRMYSKPVNAEEVNTLYHLVK